MKTRLGERIGWILGCLFTLGATGGEAVADNAKETVTRQVKAIEAELNRSGMNWPAETTRVLQSALNRGVEGPIHAAVADQVFLNVTISPEGRVKVARGLAMAKLFAKRPSLFLIRIDNQSGGQQHLKVQGTYVGDSDNPFTLSVKPVDQLGPDLVGLPVEYRLIEVIGRKAGRRELTITVEAGQGTQDLGFRSEAPILFMVEADRSSTK